jgi:hypothetical protein
MVWAFPLNLYTKFEQEICFIYKMTIHLPPDAACPTPSIKPIAFNHCPYGFNDMIAYHLLHNNWLWFLRGMNMCGRKMNRFFHHNLQLRTVLEMSHIGLTAHINKRPRILH